MSAKDIENNLAAILTARYGEEVRQNIHDAIAEAANMTSDEQSYRPSNVHIISKESATDYFTDANNAPINEGFLISNISETGIKNLPPYTGRSTLYLLTLGYSTTNTHGKIQIVLDQASTEKANFYYRMETGSSATNTSVWTSWTKSLRDIDSLYFPGIYMNKDNIDSWLFNDLNDAPNGQTCFLYSNGLSDEELKNLPNNFNKASYSIFMTIPYSATTPHGKIQFLFNQYTDVSGLTTNFYYRMETGSSTTNTSVWTSWYKVANDKQINDSLIKGHSADIFTKVVACGDSYTSGHIYLSPSEGSVTNENFAWPKFMSKLTGNDWINCGRSGANVITWQTDPRGLPKAQSSGKAQAYVIGLGLNDTASGTDRYVELGSSSDIGTNNQTYYGQYAKIIRELNAISPEAKIFVETMPVKSGIRVTYNEAIRTIAEQYADTYDVHLLDLANYMDLYGSSELSADVIQGHYTAIGYQKFAEYLRYVMSEYIDAHVSDFQDVYKIPTE